MHVLVLPVSGNFFPAQLSMLTQLIEAGYESNVLLGTSGGAVNSVLSVGADWNSSNIHRIVRRMDSTLFLQNWWPNALDFLPSWGLGFFRGSVYQHGTGLTNFMDTYFTSDALAQKEIWIGVTNKSTETPEFFCNLSQEKSILKDCSQSSHFLDGDVRKIQKAALASASILTVVPAQVIDGDKYVDGGVFYASPLTPLQDSIRQLEDKKGLHITYVNTYDIEERKVQSSVDFYPGIFQTGASTFATMVYSILFQDRINGLKLLHKDVGRLKHISIKGNQTTLKQIFRFRKTCKRSFLELYTKSIDTIDLTDFQSEDILKIMDKVKFDYYCRFWWIGSKNFQLAI
jgi:hypothetical protein